MGSGYFAFMLAVFAVLTNLVYIVLSFAAESVTSQLHYLTDCAVGFSGEFLLHFSVSFYNFYTLLNIFH